MPLIQNKKGGFVLVCINGCVPPNMTKGFDVLTRYRNWQFFPGAEALAPDQFPEASEAPIRSTMRVAEDWYALTLVKPPDLTKAAIRQALGHKRSMVPEFVAGAGTPVRIYICEVCGYTELYAGQVADPRTWGEPSKTGASNG